MITTARSFSVATAALLCLCFRRVAEGGTSCNSNRTISICPATMLLGSANSTGEVTISCRSANDQSRAIYIHRLDPSNRQNLAYVIRGQNEPSLNLTLGEEYKKAVTVSFDSDEFSLSLTLTNVSCRDAKVGYACVTEWSVKGGQNRQEDDVAFFVLLRSAPSLEIMPKKGKQHAGTVGFDAAEPVELMCSVQISRGVGTHPIRPYWDFKDDHKDQWTSLRTACRGGGNTLVQIEDSEDDCYAMHSCEQAFSLAEANSCGRWYRCFFNHGNSTDAVKTPAEVVVPIKAGSGRCIDENLSNEGIILRIIMVFGILAVLVSFVIYMSRRDNTKRKSTHRRKTIASTENIIFHNVPTFPKAERPSAENLADSDDAVTAQAAEGGLSPHLYGKSVDAKTVSESDLNLDAEPKDVTTTQLAGGPFQKKDDQVAQRSAQGQDAKPGDATTTQPSITDAQGSSGAVGEKVSAPAEQRLAVQEPPGPLDRSTII